MTSWPVRPAREFCAAAIATAANRGRREDLNWPVVRRLAGQTTGEVDRPTRRSTDWLDAEAFPARALDSNPRPKVRQIPPDPTGSPAFRPATAGADGAACRRETDRSSGLDRTDCEANCPASWPSCSDRPDATDRTAIRTGTSWGTCRKATGRHLAEVQAEAEVLEFPSSV